MIDDSRGVYRLLLSVAVAPRLLGLKVSAYFREEGGAIDS